MCVEFDVLDGLLLKIFSEKSQRNKTGKKKLTVIASSTSRIEDATPSPKAIPTITSKINRPPKTHWMIDKTLNTFPLSAIVVFFWGVELTCSTVEEWLPSKIVIGSFYLMHDVIDEENLVVYHLPKNSGNFRLPFWKILRACFVPRTSRLRSCKMAVAEALWTVVVWWYSGWRIFNKRLCYSLSRALPHVLEKPKINNLILDLIIS